ncbi:MAG: Hsp20/alpha crystallin family protein [Acidobacteriota bacterium]
MANLTVRKLENNDAGIVSGLKIPQDRVELVRQRAFDLFERRGRQDGKEIDDWIQAERELFWVPPAELAETDKEVEINVAMPGFDPKEVQVSALPGEILVQGNQEMHSRKKEKGLLYSEFEEKALYRRFEISQPIDIDRITANIENGMLTIKAPKKAPQSGGEKKSTAAA